MATGFNIPSMFEARQAVDRQMETDAQTAGRLPLGGGMMYASSMVGDIKNQGLMNVAGLLGGVGNPIMDQQRAITEVMEQFPNPQSAEDYTKIAGAMNSKGLYNYAEMAMDRANEIKSQLPTKSTAWKEYSEMTDNPTPEGFKDWYKEFKITGSKTPLTAKQEAFKQYQLKPEYMSGELTAIDFEREWSKAGREETQPDKMNAKDIALQEFLVSPEYQGGKKTIIDFETEWSAAGRAPKDDGARLSAKEQSLDNFINSSDYIGNGGKMTIMDWNKKWTESGQSPTSKSAPDPEKLAKTNLLNSEISKAFDILSSDPANRGMPENTILQQAKVIGSDAFLASLESNNENSLNVSTDVGDFEYWKARNPLKSDEEIFQIMAVMNSSSPYNVNINQTRQFNKESIRERTDQLAVDSMQVSNDLVRTQEMLRAYEEGAKTGWGQTWINTGNKIAQEFFGLPQEAGTVQTDRLEQLFKGYTLDRMGKLKGTPSDKDLDLVERAGATMDRSRAANTMIIEFDRFLLQEQANQHEYMINWLESYIRKNEEYPAGFQWDSQVNQFRNRNDKSKWKGEESTRLNLIQAYGTNEFDEEGTLEAIEARQTLDEIEINQIIEETDYENEAAKVYNRYGIKG